MLINFKVRNFLSFENEECFSMVAGKGRAFANRVYQDKHNKILKFASLFGANGSGKSNFVKAIGFSKNYIAFGNPRAFIDQYYKLNPGCKDMPTLFEYKIKIADKVYTYGFEAVLSHNELISEWLISNNVSTDKIIFKYNRENKGVSFGNYFKNEELKHRLEIYGEGMNPDGNTLFLRMINENKQLFLDYDEASVLQDVFYWFVFSLKVKMPDTHMSDYDYFMSPKNMDQIIKIFDAFDLSISSYEFTKASKDEIALKVPKEIFNDFLANIEKALFENDDEEQDNEHHVMFGINDDFYIAKAEGNNIIFQTLKFYHGRYRETPFSMQEESDGTKKIFKLLEILFQEDQDVTYVVDEIDRCLHPLLTYNFISAFLEKANKNNCQLIATTHESILLDFNLLRKDEIWIVSQKDGSSYLESMGRKEIRADKKLSKTFLLGEIGVPKIKYNMYKG